MKGLLVLLAVAVNAELSHRDKMNLVVVNQNNELVYPAREMEKVGLEITKLEQISHALDMKLTQMEDLNLRDPEVWKKYTRARDSARTASTTLEALREKMQQLEDQYVDAEKSLKHKIEPGLLLQTPGDSALLADSNDDEDDEGTGPSKYEVEREEMKKEHFKMVAENFEDDVEEKLVATPGISREEAEDEVNEEKTWSDEVDEEGEDELDKGESLLEEEKEEEEKELAEKEKKMAEKPKLAKKIEKKAEAKKEPSKWQKSMSLLATGVENKLVETDADYHMSLFLAEQGLSMKEISDELHPVDERKLAETSTLSQAELEEAARRQEEALRVQIKEERAQRNLQILELPSNLKIKSRMSKEAEWQAEFLRMEEAEASEIETNIVAQKECLNTPDDQINFNHTDEDALQLKKIFYINLEKSKFRAKSMETWLEETTSKYSHERWPASTKEEADKEHYAEFSRRGKHHGYQGKGTVATYLSHTFLLKHIANLENGVYMVLEDDSKPKGKEWADEVMCHIRELPQDWHFYKFGYWNTGGHGCADFPKAGKFSCKLTHHSYEFMGNQGYAVTPRGAKRMLKHLYEMPVMDIDGAMMSGQAWGNLGSKIDANYYVAKHTYLQHDQSLGSQRESANGGKSFFSIKCDTETKAELCEEEVRQNNDEDGRESSFAAKQRVARSFLKTGKMPWEISWKTENALERDWAHRQSALV